MTSCVFNVKPVRTTCKLCCDFIINGSSFVCNVFSVVSCLDVKSSFKLSVHHIYACILPRCVVLLVRYVFLITNTSYALFVCILYAMLSCCDRIVSVSSCSKKNGFDRSVNNKLRITIAYGLVNVFSIYCKYVNFNMLLLGLDIVALLLFLFRLISDMFSSFVVKNLFKDIPGLNLPKEHKSVEYKNVEEPESSNAEKTQQPIQVEHKAFPVEKIDIMSHEELKGCVAEKLSELEEARNSCNLTGVRPFNNAMSSFTEIRSRYMCITGLCMDGFEVPVEDIKKQIAICIGAFRNAVAYCRKEAEAMQIYLDKCVDIEESRQNVLEFINRANKYILEIEGVRSRLIEESDRFTMLVRSLRVVVP